MIKAKQIYRHFKGNTYQIMGVAKHSDTLEDMVIYHRYDDETDMWVRRLQEFEENLADGSPRFQLLDNL